MLKLGKSMVTVDMKHGRLETNVWCSNLAVTKIGDLITQVGVMDNEDKFIPYPECGSHRYVYVLGFSDHGYHESAVACLMRLMCILITNKVETMISRPVDGRRSFTNGGVLHNGNIVEEAIIYTPHHGYNGVDDYQAIFSLYPAYNDVNGHNSEYLRKPKLKLNNVDRWISGVRLQEDGSPRRFSDALGTLNVRVEYACDMPWVMNAFGPEETRPSNAEYAVSVHLGELMQYCTTVAQLIYLNYFDGKSYMEARSACRVKAVTDVDYARCGLYKINSSDQEYYAYPGSYSGIVNLYHRSDDNTKDFSSIKFDELANLFTHIDGRRFNAN